MCVVVCACVCVFMSAQQIFDVCYMVRVCLFVHINLSVCACVYVSLGVRSYLKFPQESQTTHKEKPNDPHQLIFQVS